MYLLELVLELREALGDVLTMPAPDSIINFMQRVKNKIPAFATKKHSAVNQKTAKTHDFYVNEPSEYIKHIVGQPGMTSKNPDCFRGFGYTVARNIDNRFNIVVPRGLKEEQHLLWLDQSFVER
ncbi:hypothetical protein CU098_007833 [Rhizopus stolonifer]|uniref:Uncharacterized protein n=1 Tax=Rhizopus stolonifer TaxID=4846 RepID=A0A367ITS2_RHIST|nr:hypothetical protein CU098_007833 [Rhizopus stolonifer]